MATLYDEAGQPVELDGEEAQRAYLSGQLGFQQGAPVRLIGPDGGLFELPSENTERALSSGYRFPTTEERQAREQQEKFGSTGGEVAAGAAAAARGLTVGLSDPALRLLGVPRQTLKGLKEANPDASLGGEVAGTIASLALPGPKIGPASLVSKAGLAAERAVVQAGAATVGRKLAAKAVGGAVEGSLFGLGQAVSEATLEGTPLTAEKLASHALGGALTGGGLNVVGAGVGAAAKGAAGVAGLTGKSLQESLEQFATDRTIKAIAGNGHLGALRKLEHKGIFNQVAKDAIDDGVLTAGSTADDILERATAKAEGYGKEIQDIIAFGDAKAQPLVSGEGLAQKIRSELVAPLQKGNVGDQAVANRLLAEADNIASKGDLSFADAQELKRSFDKYLKWGAEQAPVQEQLKKVRGIINSDIETKLTAIGDSLEPGLGERFKLAKQKFRSMREIEDLAEERVQQLRNNRSISPSDYGVGSALGLLSGGPAGLAAGAASALGHKLLRERGPQVLAVGLRKLADSKVVDRVAKAFHRTMQSRMQTAPELFGPFRGVLASAAARGADDLLATHVALAKADPAYQDTMASMGMVQESPEEAEGHARRLEQLERLQAVADESDARADAAIGRFLGTQGGARPKRGAAVGEDSVSLRAGFKDRAEKLAKLAGNPSALADALQPDETLTSASPELAAEAVAVAARAAEFLHSKAPKPLDVGVPAALARPFVPSNGELLRWQRYVAAVENPQEVLAELARGQVSPESVEALRVVYPRLLEDIRSRMMERVGAHPKSLSPRQRTALATLFEAPMGGAYEANHIQLVNQAHAASQAAEAQKQAANAQRVKSKSAQSLMTPAQRAEARSATP